MITLDGQYNLSVKVNGIELDNVINLVRYLGVYENANELLPTMEMELIGPLIDQALIPFYDGCLVEVLLEPQVISSTAQPNQPATPAVWMPFRVFKTETVPENDIDIIKVTGYYDAPEYFLEAGFGFFQGSSVSVAQQVAKAASLKFDGDPASDSQIWYQAGLSGGAFLQDVAKHAWASNNSCFVAVVCRDSTLRYYDLNVRSSKQPQWTFVYSNIALSVNDNQQGCSSLYSVPNNGLLNKWRGYGIIAGNENLAGNGGAYNQVTIQNIAKTTDKLQVNSDLANPTKYEPGPIDIGNTHQNYFRGKVQNERFQSIYSDSFRVMMERPKRIMLLDRVQFNVNQESKGTLRHDYSGNYFITQFAQYVIKGHIMAMATLTKEGINLPSADLRNSVDLLG